MKDNSIDDVDLTNSIFENRDNEFNRINFKLQDK